jgi:hypothetical protein
VARAPLFVVSVARLDRNPGSLQTLPSGYFVALDDWHRREITGQRAYTFRYEQFVSLVAAQAT